MSQRFYERDRAAGVVREFADGNVRVEINLEVVLVVIANGYCLPGDVGEAHDYAEQFTDGRDKLLAICADDDVSGDRAALVLIYANTVGMAGLVPVP